jgi:hypothetical protein
MVEQGHAIIPAEPVTSRRRGYALRNRAWVVEDPLDDLCRDLSHACRLDVIVEQVGDHATGAGRGKTVQQQPLPARHLAAVQAYVGPAGLASRRKRELVHVGTQIADAVQGCSRGMRDECHIGRAHTRPPRFVGLELKPGRPKLEMVWLGSPTNSVNAVCDTLEQPVTGEARERACAHPGFPRLLSRAKTPLLLGDVKEPLEWTSHTAKYAENRILRSLSGLYLLQNTLFPA